MTFHVGDDVILWLCGYMGIRANDEIFERSGEISKIAAFHVIPASRSYHGTLSVWLVWFHWFSLSVTFTSTYSRKTITWKTSRIPWKIDKIAPFFEDCLVLLAFVIDDFERCDVTLPEVAGVWPFSSGSFQLLLRSSFYYSVTLSIFFFVLFHHVLQDSISWSLLSFFHKIND